MYSPPLGRFLSRDPLPQRGEPDILFDNNWFGERLGQMLNLYGYVASNPLQRVDPYGLECTPANPPLSILPPEDELHPVGSWRTQTPKGYPIVFATGGRLHFKNITCDCCTMDIEVIARAYRYYRYEGPDRGFVGYTGGPGEENDPRSFFTIVVVTVCKSNVNCDHQTKKDRVEVDVSEPLQKDGRGVFIRQGQGDIETTAAKFKPDSPCDVGSDFLGFIEQNVKRDWEWGK